MSRAAGLVAQQQHRKSEDHIDADLAHDRKHRAHGRRGRCVGRRQPERKRPHAGFDEERDAKDGGAGLEQEPVVIGNERNSRGQVRYVERAGDAIDQADADEEQRRCREIDRDVLHARSHALRARAMQHQPVRGGQQHFEEDEQVEQVAREEGPIDPHQQQLKEAMEVEAGAMPPRRSENDRCQRQDRCQCHHQGRQAVDDQNDPERRGPVPQQICADLAAARIGAHQQCHRDGQQDHRCRNTDGEFDRPVFE